MKSIPKTRSQKPRTPKGINVLELGKQVSENVFCLGFACADKDTPLWAKHVIKAGFDFLKPNSRKRREPFPTALAGSVALIKGVTAAVKQYCKPVHQRKARAAVRELIGSSKQERS